MSERAAKIIRDVHETIGPVPPSRVEQRHMTMVASPAKDLAQGRDLPDGAVGDDDELVY